MKIKKLSEKNTSNLFYNFMFMDWAYLHIYHISIFGENTNVHNFFNIISDDLMLKYSYVTDRIKKEMDLKDWEFWFMWHTVFINK
jgi:hypothetical protein